MNRFICLQHHLRTINIDRSMASWNWCMSIVDRCLNMRQFKAIHAIFITHGIHRNNFAISKLLTFCALSDVGDLSYASLLFSQTPQPNTFACNVLIRAYSRTPQPYSALHYLKLMLQNDTLRPDSHTFPFVLIACANGLLVSEGRQIHTMILKNGLCVSSSHVKAATIRFYVECKVLDDARKVFVEIPGLDAIHSDILMNGYLRSGSPVEALSVFQAMLVRQVEPDEFCLTTALTACAHSGCLEQGKWIHDYVRQKHQLSKDEFVQTALLNMYAKCGHIEMAEDVFWGMPKRSSFSWAAMINAFAAHGQARKAIKCLEKMQLEDRLKPDGVVLVGVLVACTHAGLLKEGKYLLENMEALYGIAPGHEHYSCVVDLLCRGGQLGEALELIQTMPMKPLASVWGALLTGCRIYNNVILAELAAGKLIELKDGNQCEEDRAYVQLYNIYLANRKTDEARKMRGLIGNKGLKKTPGCSAIEVDGKVSEFVAGDVSHACAAEMYAILDLMCLDSLTNRHQ